MKLYTYEQKYRLKKDLSFSYNVFLSLCNELFSNCLTADHNPPITTEVPYANSFDLHETLSNLASHPDSSCLTLRHFHNF